jgi:hypothetical protein
MSLDSSESIAMQEAQREVCRRFGATFLQPRNDDKLGVALHTLSVLPLNGLRHPTTEGTSGWYVWGGGEPGDDPEFLAPLHIAHLPDACPAALPYLGLPPGWRFLVAPDAEDVWFDASLLAV